MTNLTRISLLAEQILLWGQLVVPQPDFSNWQRRVGGGTLSSGSSRSDELRRKELPHQFQEEHRYTRKQAALSAFPFFNTVYLYSGECSSHAVSTQVRETTLSPWRAQRRHVFLKAFSMLASFCTLKTIHTLKGMLDLGAKGHN